MNPTTLSQIAAWTDGELLSGDAGTTVTDVCTDSRSIKAGDLFLALKGGNFDGHAFVPEAARRGAAAAIVEVIPESLPRDMPIVRVANVLASLQLLAGRYRDTLAMRTLGITGSNGKTSTKDFAAAALSARFAVIKTEGNLNNHIGVPLMLLKANSTHEVGVFEVGMNHAGEIQPLVKLIRPVAGIITNIGVAHIEFLGSREAIAREKGELAEFLPPDGALFLNAKDAFSAAIALRSSARTILAGIDQGEVRARNLRPAPDGTEFTIENCSGSAAAFIPVPGCHMVENAVLAVAAARFLGCSLAEAAAGLREAQLTKGRLQQKLVRDIRILDDTYNANPDSVAAAIATLSQIPARRRLAVLGRMNELGAEFEQGHRAVGEKAAREGIDCVISVGDGADLVTIAARERGSHLRSTPLQWRKPPYYYAKSRAGATWSS